MPIGKTTSGTTISGFFEARFARLEYAGNEKFNMAYKRHTGQWWEIFQDFTLG